MPYKRKTVVPNARLSDGGLRMFECLNPEEKDVVFRHFMEHWDAARIKNVCPDDIPELPKLDRRLSNCLEALCQSADEGISDYWKITERNARNAPKASGQPLDNDWSTAGKPINKPINQLTNKPPNQPTFVEIETYCRENALTVDAQAFWEIMEKQGWRGRDGRPVEDWKILLRSWGKGKMVSAQQYSQRNYSESELLAVSDDLMEEARKNRETTRDDPEP